MVQLLKEQNKYDQMPSALCNWLQRILPFAKKVADAVITKETQILNSRSRREWALGSFFWFIWKHHMKEVHDSSYCFVPGLHTDTLNATLTEEPSLTSHS